jgi:hypothetical protein
MGAIKRKHSGHLALQVGGRFVSYAVDKGRYPRATSFDQFHVIEMMDNKGVVAVG